MDKFGERLLELLKQKNISQRDFAEAVDLTECSISRYINGERIPNALTLYKIAKALNVSCDYLLGINKSDITYEDVYSFISNNFSKMSKKQRNGLIIALLDFEETPGR